MMSDYAQRPGGIQTGSPSAQGTHLFSVILSIDRSSSRALPLGSSLWLTQLEEMILIVIFENCYLQYTFSVLIDSQCHLTPHARVAMCVLPPQIH